MRPARSPLPPRSLAAAPPSLSCRRRAFGTWSSNHQRLGFFDATDLCDAQNVGQNCSEAEVYIRASAPTSEEEAAWAAHVTALPMRCTAADRAAGEPRCNFGGSNPRGRRTTAGEWRPNDYTIGYADMVFNTEVCWYLDNTFCVGFHSLYALGTDPKTIIMPLACFLFGSAMIYTCYLFFTFFKV